MTCQCSYRSATKILSLRLHCAVWRFSERFAQAFSRLSEGSAAVPGFLRTLLSFGLSVLDRPIESRVGFSSGADDPTVGEALLTMTQKNDTPTEGQESTATQGNWEGVGRQLLADELQQSATEVSVAFHQASVRVSDGEQPSASEVEELIESLRGAYWIVESAAEASPEVDAEELPPFQGAPGPDAE